MNRTLALYLLSGVLLIVLTAGVLSVTLPRVAAAAGEPGSLACVDSNGNGIVDRS